MCVHFSEERTMADFMDCLPSNNFQFPISLNSFAIESEKQQIFNFPTSLVWPMRRKHPFLSKKQRLTGDLLPFILSHNSYLGSRYKAQVYSNHLANMRLRAWNEGLYLQQRGRRLERNSVSEGTLEAPSQFWTAYLHIVLHFMDKAHTHTHTFKVKR